MEWDVSTGFYIEYEDWKKCFCFIPKKSLEDKWIWGSAYIKTIDVYDGIDGTNFRHYLKTEKEVFVFKLKEGT